MSDLLESKIDISKASLEELEEVRDILRDILMKVNHEINGRKIAGHKHNSSSSSDS